MDDGGCFKREVSQIVWSQRLLASKYSTNYAEYDVTSVPCE
jgi:hypothetical protein